MAEGNRDTKMAKNSKVQHLIVWLDSHLDLTDSAIQRSLFHLHRIFSRVEAFIDADECVDFITKLNDDDECTMIITNPYDEHILLLIHSVSCVKTIYILASKEEQWINKDYTKVQGVYSDIQSLCNQLHSSSHRLQEPLSFSTFPPVLSSSSTNPLGTKQEAMFMYAQLVRDILLEINENRDEAKREMLEECRQRWENNDTQLRHIDDFEKDYTAERAVWWFTRDAFLYRILNQALRTQDIVTLYKLRLFIKDLHLQLKSLHDAAMKTNFTVYRGQGMSHDEFRVKLLNNVGGLLSINTFMSTSLNQNVGDMFVVRDPLITSVLFQMEIDSHQSITNPFADIHHLSAMSDEDEVLFSMGAVFRILSVEQSADGIWHVGVRLTTDEDKELAELREHMRKQIWHPRHRLQLGKLALEMGEFTKAEVLYKTMLDDSNFIYNDSLLRALLHSDLGAIYGHCGQYTDCLDEYERAIKLNEQHHPPNCLAVAAIHCNKSATLFLLGEYDRALFECRSAITIEQSTGAARPLRLAAYNEQMGEILLATDKVSEALNCYERARTIRVEHMPANHPDLASLNNKIASAYAIEERFDEAYNYCKQALTIQLACLPPGHIGLSETYGLLGNIAYGQSHYDEARQQQECALEILVKNLPTNHLLTAHMHVSLAMTLLALEEREIAASHTTQALAMFRAILPSEHSEIQQTQALLSIIQRQ